MKTIIAIIVIGAVEVVALMKGIDGVLLAASVAILGGLGGFSSKELIAKIKAIKK